QLIACTACLTSFLGVLGVYAADEENSGGNGVDINNTGSPSANSSGLTITAHTYKAPFGNDADHLIVKCKLDDGDEVEFLLDTGTSHLIIDRRVAADQGLDKLQDSNLQSASGQVEGNLSRLDKLQIGDLTLEQVPALIVDLSETSRQIDRQIAGIIGTEVLK